MAGGSLSGLADWIFGALGLLGLGSGGGALAYVRGTRETATEAKTTAERVERRQIGDPDDPNAEGVVNMVKETRDGLTDTRGELREFRQEMNREHRSLAESVEEIRETVERAVE